MLPAARILHRTTTAFGKAEGRLGASPGTAFTRMLSLTFHLRVAAPCVALAQRHCSARDVVLHREYIIVLAPTRARSLHAFKCRQEAETNMATPPTKRRVAAYVTPASMGIPHVKSMEATREAVYPAFLATRQRMHDLHAGELGQRHEPSALDGCAADRTVHRTPGGTLDLHAGFEALRASIWQCSGPRVPDGVGRRLLAQESLPHPRGRAHRDGCRVGFVRAGRLLSP